MALLLPFLIALSVGLLAFVWGYNTLYRRRSAVTAAEKRVAAAYELQQITSEADPKSPEYKLAAAGIRTGNPAVIWAVLNYAPSAVVFLGAVFFGFPILVALGAGLVALVAPAQWVEGRIKDRGRRIEADLPQVYVELLAILRANPDVGGALLEIADGLEQEKGPTPLSAELRLAAQEALSANVGRTQAMQNLQWRSPSISLSNLGLLLERFVQTGAGQGGSFFEAFATGAGNVQSILESRQKAQAKAADAMQSARIVPMLLAATLLFFMGDPAFRASFNLPIVQLILAGSVVVMYAGYQIMTDMAKEAA